MIKRVFLLTNDVETTSLVNHSLSDETGKLVSEVGIPKMLDICTQFNIKSTFFITGYFAEKFPAAVKRIFDSGHEVACHGYSHKHTDGFDILSLSQQIEHLKKAKNVLESIISDEVISFRAPALRTNQYTVEALEKTGFKIDSSVASQRFDFFFSLGSKEKLSWLKAPRKPYYTSPNSLSKQGNSSIYEIPISALMMPYIGTTLRIFPGISNILRILLGFESCHTGKPINFLIHPIELLNEEVRLQDIKRRNKSYINYLLKDKLRHYLKLKNLGDIGVNLLEKQIEFFKEKNYEFITLKEYWRNYGKID